MNYCFHCGATISNLDECLTCRLNLKNYKRLFSSYQNFERVLRNNNEYRYLPNYLTFKSKTYLYQSSIERRFRIYKRGTLCIVDFGYNIGSEFRGRHFAIVIDKKDNIWSESVLVVPLSSKSKGPYRVALNTVISDILEKVYEKVLKIIDDSSEEIDKETKMRLLNSIAIQIEKYNKHSWALIKDIRKISKLRIQLPKTIYDPIGRARVPNEVLNAIDEKIIECFLK